MYLLYVCVCSISRYPNQRVNQLFLFYTRKQVLFYVLSVVRLYAEVDQLHISLKNAHLSSSIYMHLNNFNSDFIQVVCTFIEKIRIRR